MFLVVVDRLLLLDAKIVAAKKKLVIVDHLILLNA